MAYAVASTANKHWGTVGGPEARARHGIGAQHRSAEGLGLGRGAVAPPQHSPRKKSNFNMQICAESVEDRAHLVWFTHQPTDDDDA